MLSLALTATHKASREARHGNAPWYRTCFRALRLQRTRELSIVEGFLGGALWQVGENIAVCVGILR
jgi:hypothetical protein